MSRMGETYWAKRAAARMAEEELSAEKRLSALAVPYRRAQGAILAQIKGIQSAYMRRYGVDEEDMRQFLSHPADKKTLERLARMIDKMPAGREKRRLQAQLNAPGTRYRISNLQAMREQVKAAAETLSGEEQRLFTDSLTRTIRESYLRDSYDLQKRAGVLLEPNGVSTRFVRQALREDWSGKNYKTRIEGRYEDLARRVQESILQNLLGGGSQARMAEDIAREFRTSYHAAKRLMTTETCYVMNAAHVEGFEEYAVPEYRIIAVLDLRTSDICQEQDGKIYKRDEAVAGETMPPFHPNCRSTVSPVTDRKWLETMERRATDPVTGETETLAPGTTYPQWLKMIEERYGKEKIDALREEQKAKVTAKNEAVQKKIERMNNPENITINRPQLGEKSPSLTLSPKNGTIVPEGGNRTSGVNSPIEQRNTGKGTPSAIQHYGNSLNRRQQALLDLLPGYDRRVTVGKKEVNLRDIAALTAKTGDEFALFTRKEQRLVIRGNAWKTNIDVETAKQMALDGWRWSGHTHPGVEGNTTMPSSGDYEVLKAFKQRYSVILDSFGRYAVFGGE